MALQQTLSSAARMRVVDADITSLHVDAIVNAANTGLHAGGGVCGAIHRAAGPELEAASLALGGCAVGDAKMTPGFRLPARFVIHAVGPVWRGGGEGEPELLAACYRRSLELAADQDLHTVAFPAISTGIFGFPPELAAPIAVGTVAAQLDARPNLRVIFCCFSSYSAELHEQALTDQASVS
ncbi:MAG: O-acetyl-ADP-ribose deacetylase [Geminicoccaceae bacterium]